MPVHEEEAVSKTPGQQETPLTHVKGTSIPLEHIDLLRPVPTSKEDYASKANDDEEQ